MKLIITLSSATQETFLPLHHNHFIQAALYQLLDPVYANFLHQKGYSYGNRQFRLFSFSRLLGKYKIYPEQGTIAFTGPIQLIVLSPLQPMSEGILNSLIMGKEIRIGSCLFEIKGVKIELPQVTNREILVRTLSPIVSYSTMLRPDGRKFTYYFEPAETEFAQLVASNLYKKLKAWESETALDEKEFDFLLTPHSQIQRRIVMYKSNVIKGYSGHYLLQGDPKLLQFALNVGLGSKGAQGFGVVDVFPMSK